MINLLDFVIIWLGISMVLLATGCYIAVAAPIFLPKCWKRIVVDIEPNRRISRR